MTHKGNQKRFEHDRLSAFRSNTGKTKAPMNSTEALLREKVVFWRELIREREKRLEPVLPRMREALAYAERKLRDYLSDEDSNTGRSESMIGQRVH
jgi:hypothetical protein